MSSSSSPFPSAFRATHALDETTLRNKQREEIVRCAFARSRRLTMAAVAAPDLPDDMISEVLLRLPPKSLLRCRAVCKAWRGLASDRTLLLAHHRRQPARPLIYYPRDSATYIEFCLEALDLRAGTYRSVVRFTGAEEPRFVGYGQLSVHGSCGGLLLISFVDSLYICNPATRQWAPVPPLPTDEIAGLYEHGPTGEYRVLYHRGEGLDKAYYILTVGSEETEGRSIRRPASSTSMDAGLRSGPLPARSDPPVLLHSNLHWPPQPEQDNNILVFDTVAEVFRWMRAPIKHCVASLFEMDGTLAMSSREHVKHPVFVDLWLLQDYESETWVRRYSFEFEVVETTIRSFGDLPEIAASFIVSQQGDVLVECSERLLHYDMEANLLTDFQCEGRFLMVTEHLLKESLVPQPFFQINNSGSVAAPPFFQGV